MVNVTRMRATICSLSATSPDNSVVGQLLEPEKDSMRATVIMLLLRQKHSFHEYWSVEPIADQKKHAFQEMSK